MTYTPNPQDYINSAIYNAGETFGWRRTALEVIKGASDVSHTPEQFDTAVSAGIHLWGLVWGGMGAQLD